jgi:hypothetical protein
VVVVVVEEVEVEEEEEVMAYLIQVFLLSLKFWPPLRF